MLSPSPQNLDCPGRELGVSKNMDCPSRELGGRKKVTGNSEEAKTWTGFRFRKTGLGNTALDAWDLETVIGNSVCDGLEALVIRFSFPQQL